MDVGAEFPNDHARIKLQKMLGMNEGIEIWIDPSATTHPEIPSHIDNVPLNAKDWGQPATNAERQRKRCLPGIGFARSRRRRLVSVEFFAFLLVV